LFDAGFFGNAGKCAGTQQRGFQRELRRQPGPDLRGCRRCAGLIVEQRKFAVGQIFDPVRSRAQGERAFANGNR
jgi:hypothetical protein